MRDHLEIGPFDPALRQPLSIGLELNNGIVDSFHLRRAARGFDNGAVFVGLTAEAGLALAGRICGRSSIAHSIAFCRAVEDALEIDVDGAADILRAVLAEFERIGSHLEVLADIARYIEDNLFFTSALRYTGKFREAVRILAGDSLGTGAIVPGGVMVAAPGGEILRVPRLEKLLSRLAGDCGVWERKVKLQERRFNCSELKAGSIPEDVMPAPAFRASGDDGDLRYGREAYGHYERVAGKPVLAKGGLTTDRILVLIREVKSSVLLIEKIYSGNQREPAGLSEVKIEGSAGTGYSEGPHGALEYRLEIDSKGKIAGCELVTASEDVAAAMVSAIPGTPYEHLIPSILSFCPCPYCMGH